MRINIVFLMFLSVLGFSQDRDSSVVYGLNINTVFHGDQFSFLQGPAFVLEKNKNQVEIGMLYNTFDRSKNALGGQFNFKHFPNGKSDKFNLFFLLNTTFLNSSTDSTNPITKNQWSFNGGYGFRQRIKDKLYYNTSLSFGILTQSSDQEASLPVDLIEEKIFNSWYLNYEIAFSLGYRL